VSDTRKIATALVIAGWAAWGPAAVVLLATANAATQFVAMYIAYWIFGAVILVACRRDLLAPAGLFTLMGLIAFGLSIPLIYCGSRYIETSDYTSFDITDDSLLKVLVIVIVAQAAFVLGSYLDPLRFLPLNRALRTAPMTRRVSLATYLLVASLVVVSGATRIRLHLGEAGVQPTLNSAGYFQYTLFDGILLICVWFLAQGLRQSRFYVLLGLSLLVAMAVVQALLGWRGGIGQVGWIVIGLFWYQLPDSRTRRPHSFAWLIVLLLVAGSIVQFGDAVRSERLGGERQFAGSIGDLIEKSAYRAQGITRLAVVAEKFGPLTIFNNFLIKDIYAQGLTTTTYVDMKFYAVAVRQSHSVGTSGPGGPYVAMGLFGVTVAYMMLGAFYKWVYSGVTDADGRKGNIVATVFYSYLMFMLLSLLGENFGIQFLKNMIAVSAFLFLLKISINKGSSPEAGSLG
jgi:hypothetical protein